MNRAMPLRFDLLRPIPGLNPSGADLRYTAVYDQIKEARREDPDLPQGVWKRERKTADWGAVADLCADALVNKTKDLQVAAWLAEAWTHRDGFCGLAEGLNLLRGLVDRFWATVYPRADEDELELRAGPLEWLGSRFDIAVKTIPLTSTGMDWFGLPAAQQSDGTIGIAPGNYRSRLDEVDSCLSALRALNESCEAHFDDAAPRFDGLRISLEAISLALKPFVGARSRATASEESLPAFGSTAKSVPWINSALPLDSLHFTVTAPSAIAAASSVVVTLWVHLESQRAAVMERACHQHQAQERAGIMSISKGPLRIARGAALTVRLELTGAHLDDREDIVLWEGEIGCANFVAAIPANPKKQSIPGKAVIYLDGVQVAKVLFVLQVGTVSGGDTVPATETRVRKAFASYASADRDEVLGRLQGIRKAAPHMDIFFDVLTLRSGQNWEHQIESMIAASDIFYLFWSLNASSSMWVEREWRTALQTGRRDFIDPVPLQTPEEAPPPLELAGLHFNDWMLAFQRRKVFRSTT